MAKNGMGGMVIGAVGGAAVMFFAKPMIDEFLGNMQNQAAYARARRAYARARAARYY